MGDDIDHPSSGGTSSSYQIPFLSGKRSFKVIIECPLIVMLLLQLYQNYIERNIPTLISLMIKAIRVKAPPMSIRTHRARYSDLIACQVRRYMPINYPSMAWVLMLMYGIGENAELLSLLGQNPIHEGAGDTIGHCHRGTVQGLSL